MSNDETSDDDLPEDLPEEEAFEADEDATSDEDEDPAEAVPAAPSEPARSRIGLIMFASAGALWGLFGMMRCDAKEDGQPPTAAVTEVDADEQPLPSVEDDPDGGPERALPDEAPEPEPAAETPDRPRPEPEAPEPEPLDAGDFDPRPKPAAWAHDFKVPSRVEYTVRRGGTLENVANLYKIFHHEITALNPGVKLEQELPPKTAVVVYEGGGDESSQSVGLPSNGKLQGGVPMVDGPGRLMKMIGWKSFGTANTVAVLDKVLRRWQETGHRQPVLVGNMSSRTGGKLAPHSTHQSGRDVDLGYLQLLPAGEELNWRLMDGRNLDAKETWALMSMLVQTGQVEVIYVDREIQKLLHEYAVEQQLMPKSALAKWMEYPSPTGSGDPVMQHVKGHADHMHVRFKCQPHEKQCQSR